MKSLNNRVIRLPAGLACTAVRDLFIETMNVNINPPVAHSRINEARDVGTSQYIRAIREEIREAV